MRRAEIAAHGTFDSGRWQSLAPQVRRICLQGLWPGEPDRVVDIRVDGVHPLRNRIRGCH